jgi:hypothetical protein
MESDEEHELLESIYKDLRLYINFFQPVLKLIGKERIGNKVIRRYDVAKTPYQRVMVADCATIMEREDVSLDRKAHLLPALGRYK